MAEDEKPKRRGAGRALMLGAVLAAALGGGAFYAVHSGLVLGEIAVPGSGEDSAPVAELAPVSFVQIEPLMVSLGRTDPAQFLRFEGHLEVAPGRDDAVAMLMPRIMDVLNGYLRAVETGDLRDPAALIRLRAQMLRRIQVVTGDGMVRDLLITKFLVS